MSAPSAPRPQRVRVAILGGGCGGLAAAWELTATPALRDRFEVTVHQQGWRLGGKGASGRAHHASGSPADGLRIEEHGLHIWFGFYEHAFRMLRGAYEEAGLATGNDWWTIPFERCDSVTLYERGDDASWSRHSITLPRRGGRERGPPTEPRQDALARVTARTARVLANGLRSDLGARRPRRGEPGRTGEVADLDTTLAALEQVAVEIDRDESPVVFGSGADPASVLRGTGAHAQLLVEPERASAVGSLVERFASEVRGLRARMPGREASDRLRLWSGVLELVAASLQGIVRDGVLWRGFGVIDEEDLRDWLCRHGADVDAVRGSPILRGLYDLTFAYRAGDKSQPSLAAGRGLQALLLMANYEGSFMWRMRAGMGDVVFSPLYLALTRRGVRFRFFSRITGLRLHPHRPLIEHVDLIREARVAGGEDRYVPIERTGDWWCWPAVPDEGQLAGRRPTRGTLARGVDFDELVLAIPVGALGEICGELAAANPRFRQMLDGAETVATRAFQIWLTRPIRDLHARSERQELDPPATGYAEPFDTYCDMSHLLAAEGAASGGPRALAYFCAVLPDGTAAAEAEGIVRADARAYLEQHARVIWPAAFRGQTFDWSLVFDPLERSGPDRLDAQYFRANVDGTDRYVTTPAGSVDARLDPERSGFENLVLAGDWTRSGIDGGCVEAAVISGRRAGAAITARSSRAKPGRRARPEYVEYGALATAPGPLQCELARLYCFFVRADQARVQQLCDRVFKTPSGGAVRYRVPRVPPVVLSFGTIAGLRSLHPGHAGRGSASEPEAAIWIPAVAQRFERGGYVDEHLVVFMPYIWVDDPIAFASGREVYGFPKTQGWMVRLEDPRDGRTAARAGIPDPPAELRLDVHGVPEYGPSAELARHRLITVRRERAPRRGSPAVSDPDAEPGDMASLLRTCLAELDSDAAGLPAGVRRRSPVAGIAGAGRRTALFGDLIREQRVRHVFLKQVRDSEHGELAALQQVVEASSAVTPGTLRWRRLRGPHGLSLAPLASHPLVAELGLLPQQTIRFAFAAEFGFRMDPGIVRWP